MASKRPNYPTGVSPKGEAVHPWLNKPDEKFGKPVFKTGLRLSTEAAAGVVKKVDDMMAAIGRGDDEIKAILGEDQAKKLTAAIKAKKAKPCADLPYGDETDDAGEPTGNVILKFKKNGVYTDKEGKEVRTKLPLVDAKRKPTTAQVGGGSIITVAFSYMPWLNAKNEYGVKLGMAAVQVVELRSFGGNRDYGFGEEDGFEDSGEADTETSTRGTTGAGGDDDGDF